MTITHDAGAASATRPGRLVDLFERGLDAPICLTWELTYACNLSCVHCLSSSGRRDPRELSTAECRQVIDTLERMQVFYVNIGGGEPTVRPDFWELVEYATAHHVGVKFSTNGVKIDGAAARMLAASDYVDVQISLDGATAEVNDAVRGPGSYATAMRAMSNLRAAGFSGFKLSVVMTRQNISQLDAFKAIADAYGAQLRITRLRPSGRGADVWNELHPLPSQQRELYDWLVAHGDDVLTGDSFFHLSAYGSALPGLNLCGAGRVVCLIDPVGDVYACPFAIHESFLAGNVRSAGGFESVWRESPLFRQLREPGDGGACRSCGHYDSCRGGCMAAKFFTGLPLDGPDPECVQGYGEAALAAVSPGATPKPGQDHSHRTSPRSPVPVTIARSRPPGRGCDESPLAGFTAVLAELVPVSELVPAGLRLRPDAGARLLRGGSRLAGGAVLAGGSPVRVLRLTAGGARQVAGWLDGKPVPDSPAARQLARRLLDAGIVHPDYGEAGGMPAASDVTVVIPVRDRHAELARCLAGLRQAAEAGVAARVPAVVVSQVIVVDDCSADPAAIAAIAAAAGARVIRRPVNGGPGAARNTGLAAAATGLVAFLDSDCVPAPGWLDALLPHFTDPRCGAVAPRIVPYREAPPSGREAAARPCGPGAPGSGLSRPADPASAISHPPGGALATEAQGCARNARFWLRLSTRSRKAGSVRSRAPVSPRPTAAAREDRETWLARYEGASSTLDMGPWPSIVRPGARVSYVPGAALVVRRAAAGDGFQQGMHVGEDVDFVWRLGAAGWRVRYEPAAVMAHQHRVRLRSWFARRVDYGSSAAILEHLHPGVVRPMYASWWTAAAWTAALAGRPGRAGRAGPAAAGVAAAAAITGTATALLASRLSRVTGEAWPLPGGGTAHAWRMAARLAGGGTLAAARPLGSALSRTWWPVAIPAALAVPRLRLPVAALLIAPPLLDWAARRPPLDPARYVAARLLDDAAYGIGVWKGCGRRRDFRALLPVIGSRQAARPAARGVTRPGDVVNG